MDRGSSNFQDDLHHVSGIHLGLGQTLGGLGNTPRGAAKRKPAASFAAVSLHSAGFSGPATSATTAITSPLSSPMAVTSQPTNESELQLYRVLQRAKLLSYYDTFIAQGGDDVHQLCEAGEEEFLEIMALVGMASKPLHVRRLQKSLQEWVQNPGLFQAPLMPISSFSAPSAPASVIRPPTSSVGVPPIGQPLPALPPVPPRGTSPASLAVSASSIPPTSRNLSSSLSMGLTSQAPASPPPGASSAISRPSSVPHSPSPALSSSAKLESSGLSGSHSPSYSQAGLEYPAMSTSPLQLTPVLVESQIQKISETAQALVKALPANFEPNAKQLNKKKLSKELENVMAMSNEDPQKMEEIRKFSAIYGRFDCKRKPEKPLTLHEVSVNEAAAQLCYHLPALLMRRDKLFHLARKVVRDSGYQYSKGHSRSQFQTDASDLLGININGGDDNSSRDSSSGRASADQTNSESRLAKLSRYSEPDDFDSRASKRAKFFDTDELDLRRRERYESINDEVKLLCDRIEELRNALSQARDPNITRAINEQLELLHEKHSSLLKEQQEERRALQQYSRTRFGGRTSTSSDPERVDVDTDDDSQFSNQSSPTASPKSNQTSSHHAGNYVLSASGGQIIAVQNPALSLARPLLQQDLLHQHDSRLLNLSRDGGTNGNGNGEYFEHSSHNLRTLRSSRALGVNTKSADLVFKEEPVSPPRSTTPTQHKE